MPDDTPSDLLVRVLLAEDEPDLRLLVRRRLERSGRFEVVGEARDGSEAIDLAVDHEPEIVLLDLMMPGLDGQKALPHLVARCPRTMVVVLSALAADVHEPQTRALGAFAYLEKSVLGDRAWVGALEDLYSRFQAVLDGHEAVTPIIVGGNP